MADKHEIKEKIGKLICIKKIKMTPLSKEEKEELKQRIQMAIKQLKHENA